MFILTSKDFFVYHEHTFVNDCFRYPITKSDSQQMTNGIFSGYAATAAEYPKPTGRCRPVGPTLSRNPRN
jgi:hypothetical protein